MQNSIIINKNSPLRKFLLEMPVSKWKQTFPFSENVVYRMKSNLKHGQSINLPHNAVMNVYSNYKSGKPTAKQGLLKKSHLDY